MAETAVVQSIYRYPVKGLSPEPLPRATLAPGATLVNDRRFAIENGPSGFDPAAPGFLPKTRFLMLMKNERLAKLQARFDDTTGVLTISVRGHAVARGDLATAEGRGAVEAFFADYCRDELRGPPKILECPGHSFSDVAKKVVSIINLASVADLARAVGGPVDPLRFRANVYVAGWPAWHEFDHLDRDITIGRARLKVVKRIVRCPATNVDPATGVRDLTIPDTLKTAFGHMDCGVYAEVTTGAEITVGDSVRTPAEQLPF